MAGPPHRETTLRGPGTGAATVPVVALAGRRIDGPAADPVRFPLDRAGQVQTQLRHLLEQQGARTLVCSAACGADLLALDAAASLGLRMRVVLPFAPERFRQTSVVDRPGDWGALFDRVIAAVDRAGDLVVLADDGAQGDDAYSAANRRILQEALDLARGAEAGAPDASHRLTADVLAVIVWEGRPRTGHDMTAQFAAAARELELPVREVLTL